MPRYLKLVQTLNNIPKVCILPFMPIVGLIASELPHRSMLSGSAPAARYAAAVAVEKSVPEFGPDRPVI